MKTMVGIVDYGMGNLLSVRHALESLGADTAILADPEELADADRLVLPGVGAFAEGIRRLRETGLADALGKAVKGRLVPILGICLGMQLMARRGFEGGVHDGLGWFDGDVVRLPQESADVRLPHVGWNDVSPRTQSVLFRGLPACADFYFVHSYHLCCRDGRDVEAACEYGVSFAAAVRKDHVFATQFHPEKSQDHGLRVLENFLQWRP
ncbi:MAG: Imidazole glycerol phosphate synthase subunit HisH 1 [Syntrophaceae bacterium PtaU1.Bin231]|nr:MAG: Imidazole glycerol phosphate synthase subunit HisH 1 [Syntrophaceae bacterium PtaU1.Bin231]